MSVKNTPFHNNGNTTVVCSVCHMPPHRAILFMNVLCMVWALYSDFLEVMVFKKGLETYGYHWLLVSLLEYSNY